MDITQAELNKLAYNDQAIKQMKTSAQEYVIEKKEHEKRLRKREKMIKQAKPLKFDKIYINHLCKWINLSELTEEIKEKETELGEKMFIN